MLALAQFNLVSLGVAFLIGLATARWMFAKRPPEGPPPS